MSGRKRKKDVLDLLTPEQIEQLDADTRKTYVLAKGYEKVRRERTQPGYRAFYNPRVEGGLLVLGKEGEDEEAKESQRLAAIQWNAFWKVRQWMEAQGWEIAFESRTWQGYIKYVFDRMQPTIPQPAQLTNYTMYQDYLSSYEVQNPKPVRTKEELTELYSRILHEDVRDLGNLLERFRD